MWKGNDHEGNQGQAQEAPVGEAQRVRAKSQDGDADAAEEKIGAYSLMDKQTGASPNKPVVERAFELARSGECASVAAIRLQLKTEGYGAGEISSHLQGKSITTSLAKLCREASVDKPGV